MKQTDNNACRKSNCLGPRVDPPARAAVLVVLSSIQIAEAAAMGKSVDACESCPWSWERLLGTGISE